MHKRTLAVVMLASALMPDVVRAQESGGVLVRLAGYANILVGLLLVAGLLAFFGGFIQYIMHLGYDEREEGLHFMKWGVSVLFVLVVMLWIVQMVQQHTAAVMSLLGAALALLVLWMVGVALLTPSPEEKPEKK